MDHIDYQAVVADIMANRCRGPCIKRSFRPGYTPFSTNCTAPASRLGSGTIVCTYFDENF